MCNRTMQRKNISSVELGELKKLFPDLINILNHKSDPLQILQPCSFDHYLNNSEAVTIADPSKDVERRTNHKEMLKLFFEASDNQVYSYRFKRKNRIHIYKITNWNYLHKAAQIDSKTGLTGCNFLLISKKLNVIYEEHYDWTNLIYLFPNSDINTIREITKKSGLFLLEPKKRNTHNIN